MPTKRTKSIPTAVLENETEPETSGDETKPWDDGMKRIFSERPQDFISWLLPGATFQESVATELKASKRTVLADLLFKVKLDGQDVILHIEFERQSRKNMPQRVWEYNVRATQKYKCPVYSIVIYLTRKEDVTDPPLVWKHEKRGEVIHCFCYWQIKMWEVSVKDLRDTGLVGLLPLCLLAKDGKNFEVAQQVFQELQSKDESTLLWAAISFAELVHTKRRDIIRLERLIAMTKDIITGSRFYKRMHQEAKDEGRQEGRQEALCKAILDLIAVLFPTLRDLAEKQLPLVKDPEVLSSLITKIATAQSPEEAKRELREAVKESEPVSN